MHVPNIQIYTIKSYPVYPVFCRTNNAVKVNFCLHNHVVEHLLYKQSYTCNIQALVTTV